MIVQNSDINESNKLYVTRGRSDQALDTIQVTETGMYYIIIVSYYGLNFGITYLNEVNVTANVYDTDTTTYFLISTSITSSNVPALQKEIIIIGM